MVLSKYVVSAGSNSAQAKRDQWQWEAAPGSRPLAPPETGLICPDNQTRHPWINLRRRCILSAGYETSRDRKGRRARHGAPAGGSVSELHRLWSGEMPLDRAFWTYAVVGGLLVNVTTSVLFLMFVSADQPLAALVAGYGISVPYNLVVLVGVWRAAGHQESDRAWANLARIVTLVGMIIFTVT